MLPKLLSLGAMGNEDGFQGHMDDAEAGCGTFGRPEKGRVPMRSGQLRNASVIGPKNWMSFLDDETPLSAVTIPGTHDSAAYTMSYPFVATQKMSVIQQLDSGIRHFDFRCGLRNDIVEMVHGVTYLGLTLEDVLSHVYAWLAVQQTEALIIQIKKDRKQRNSKVDFANAIHQVLSRRSELWRTANTTPLIGDLRGRIQLFRRFIGPELYAYGIDVSEWQDNPRQPFTLHTRSGVELTIQDHYAFPRPTPLPEVIARKGANIAGLLTRADRDPDIGRWYLNFTSAFEINVVYQIPPRAIAIGGWWFFRWKRGINVRLRQHLRELEGQERRFGIVAMDFPEQAADDLIAALYMTNFSPNPAYAWQSWIILFATTFTLLSLLIVFYSNV
jgi:1-phosphatidylinositol phosphodiesterase